MKICVLLLAVAAAFASGQRITTIQLDGVQYFVSRMNPYSPELNYFLAYQYCRSLGLQLASFETKEKADTMTQYLKNAGYTKYDFWTSGNKLGTDMFLWMSSGLPFNATFDYMLRHAGNRAVDVPPGTEPQRVARESGDSGSADGCVAMIAPTLAWDAQDCTHVKDFICEQTRCYYYNYGSIPVSATQGNRRPYLTTTTSPTNDVDSDAETRKDNNETASEGVETEATEAEEQQEEHHEVDEQQEEEHHEEEASSNNGNDLENEEDASTGSSDGERLPEDPVVGRLMTTAVTRDRSPVASESAASAEDAEEARAKDPRVTRPVDIPDITTLFTDGPAVQARKETAFDGLETHEIRSSSRAHRPRPQLEHREMPDALDYETSGGAIVAAAETEAPDSALEDSHTVGPYDSVQEDYVNDQPDESAAAVASGGAAASPLQPAAQPAMNLEQQQQDEESSTFLPQAEPDYRYNMKWRSAGKVLDPPSN